MLKMTNIFIKKHKDVGKYYNVPFLHDLDIYFFINDCYFVYQAIESSYKNGEF